MANFNKPKPSGRRRLAPQRRAMSGRKRTPGSKARGAMKRKTAIRKSY